MQSGHESFDHSLGDQLQTRDGGENVGSRNCCIRYYAFGTGFMLENTFQDVVRTQAIRLGMEIEQNSVAQDRRRQSRHVFVCHVIPAVNEARALAARTMFWMPRTLAPKLTYFFTKSGAVGSVGRVMRTSSTA